LVTSIQFEGCDTDPAAGIAVDLIQFAAFEASQKFLANVATGVAETPGCVLRSGAAASGATIDNVNNTYLMIVNLGGSGAAVTKFQSVRIMYNLQTSPAPATATFNDVPTSHPFFQYIEALHTAGITQGCNVSPPLYCPDDPLTRGQAAVFFGKALGLQFAP
jgi:hypothetical protein